MSMFKIKKLGILKKNHKNADKNDNKAEKQSKNSTSPLLSKNSTIAFKNIQFDHQIDGEMYHTECPAIIIDENFIVDDNKCISKKKVINTIDSTNKDQDNSISNETQSDESNDEIVENEFWEDIDN